MKSIIAKIKGVFKRQPRKKSVIMKIPRKR
jgi:hypothetical protein